MILSLAVPASPVSTRDLQWGAVLPPPASAPLSTQLAPIILIPAMRPAKPTLAS